MNNYILSIIIPGIRIENWNSLYDSIKKTITQHTFEIIFVGPYDIPTTLSNIENIKYIKDFGCPSRALQIGCGNASGELLMWACDDGLFNPGSLDDQISQYLKTENKILNLIYTEGNSYKWGGDDRINQPENWYRGKWHDDFKGLDGIDDSTISTILFIIRTEYFKKLGGIDCRFETINFNLHDFSYRAQRAGYQLYFSDTKRPFQKIEWQPGHDRPKNEPILQATIENDKPLFRSIYKTKESAEKREIYLDFNHWKNIPESWKRKWEQKHIN